MWLNPPPTVAQLRTQLLLCPSLTGAPLNMTTSSFHYPSAVPSGPLADPMPFAVITSVRERRTRYAEGAIGLITGELLIELFLDPTADPYSDVGGLESLARALLIDLGGQYFGLCFSEMEAPTCTISDPKAIAASVDPVSQAQYSTIKIPLAFGLRAERA